MTLRTPVDQNDQEPSRLADVIGVATATGFGVHAGLARLRSGDSPQEATTRGVQRALSIHGYAAGAAHLILGHSWSERFGGAGDIVGAALDNHLANAIMKFASKGKSEGGEGAWGLGRMALAFALNATISAGARAAGSLIDRHTHRSPPAIMRQDIPNPEQPEVVQGDSRHQAGHLRVHIHNVDERISRRDYDQRVAHLRTSGYAY